MHCPVGLGGLYPNFGAVLNKYLTFNDWISPPAVTILTFVQ